MKKKLLRTFMLAAALLVGTSGWADDVANHDFNSSTTPFTIYDSNRISASYALKDGSADDYYVKYSCSNMNVVAFAYYNFSSNVTDAATVTVDFDFNINKVSGHGLITIADADFHTGTKAGFSSKSNTGYGSNGAIFNLGCWRADDSNNFAINSTKKADLTATCLGAWCHANVVINNATRKVSYKITSLDGQTKYEEASNVDFLNANAQRCSQIDIYFGYYKDATERNEASIDNLVITKTVSGTSHSYTIKAFDGESEVATIASGTATEGASYSAYIPKSVTDATGKFYILNDGSNQNLNNYYSFYTMNTANAVKTINYTLDESITYYAEAENMSGNRYGTPSASNKLSKGSAYCAYLKNSTGYIKSNMGLAYPIIADIEAGIYGRKESTATLQLINGSETTDIGTQTVAEGGSATWTKEKQLIPKESEFYMNGDNGTNASKWALDYVIIRKAYYVGGATTSITDGAYVPFTLSTMTFTFSDAYTSEEASFAVLNTATAKLYNSSDEEIATGILSVSGNVVTADFGNYALSANSTYTITLPADAVGYDGKISNTAISITVHTAAVADGEYYLKNKALGSYFAAGHKYGTQAISNTIGHKVTLVPTADGKYYIDTNIGNGGDNHYLGSNMYTDGAATGFTFTDDGEGYYTIGYGDNNINAVSVGGDLTLASGTDESKKWQLLTPEVWKAEQVARLDDATASNGKDATFYILGAGFNRNDLDNDNWTGSPSIDGLSGESCNYVAEKYNTTPFDVYQNISGLKSGVYKLTADGFYRNGTTDDRNAILYANDVETPLANIRSAGVTTQDNDKGFTTANGDYYVPNLRDQAALAFNNGYYDNELNFVIGEEGALRVGVKKTVGATYDWTCFDNFQLTYYGEAIVNVATEFASGSMMEADTWYYFDVEYADTYTLTAGSDLANIVYTTNAMDAVSVAGTTFDSNTPALTVGRYYIKSSTTQTLTIIKANIGSYLWDFTDNTTWSTSDFTSEATYKADGTIGTLGANALNFNLSGKVKIDSNGMSFNQDASASLTDNIPTNNFIKVSVPAGYKAAVEYYGYNTARYLGFTFDGTKTTGPAVAYTKKEFDNSNGESAKELYIYATGVDRDGHARLYSINLIDMSTSTHKWTATAKATIAGIPTTIGTWNSTSGDYTTTIHEGENYYVPAKRVIIYGEKKYELNDANYAGKYLYKTYNMGTSDAIHNITYTEASDIVYYSEIEDRTSNQNVISNKASNGKYVNYMTTFTISDDFLAGSYSVEANMFCRKLDGETHYYVYPESSSNPNIADFTAQHNEGVQIHTFDLTTPTSLVCGNPSNSAACDYILIRKTAEPVTLGANGYTTFASPYPLDLTAENLPDGVKAYKATVNGTTVRFIELDQCVPANTGILLAGSAGANVNIPVVASGTAVEANEFLVNTTGNTFDAESGCTYYGMKKATKAEEAIVFATFAPGTVAIPADKAYLKVSTTGNARLNVVFEDATGISTVETVKAQNDETYNLRGQRVAQPQKGLYIVNGKKVIIK